MTIIHWVKNKLKTKSKAVRSWDTNPWSNFYDPHWEHICHNKWHPGVSVIPIHPKIATSTHFHAWHGLKTNPVFLPDDGVMGHQQLIFVPINNQFPINLFSSFLSTWKIIEELKDLRQKLQTSSEGLSILKSLCSTFWSSAELLLFVLQRAPEQYGHSLSIAKIALEQHLFAKREHGLKYIFQNCVNKKIKKYINEYITFCKNHNFKSENNNKTTIITNNATRSQSSGWNYSWSSVMTNQVSSLTNFFLKFVEMTDY